MDFQFTAYQGNIIAKCSMEHEAFANWFNIEVRSNPQLISTALSYLENPPAPQDADIILTGAEYSLYINADEVVVKANNLAIDHQAELEDGFYYYDDESIAFCGIEDFARFLHSYLAFIRP
ncbi:YacL family protein [Aggregatibacter actinomycetemcomitans]|nr:YacL family protein [Aggregatibacter actinomycetemcomitans]